MVERATESADHPWAGYTLVVPAVAVGNVAQLAVDLFIHNCGMKKIGRLESPDFIPFLGADPYDTNSSDICTAAEFYVHREKRLIALQIRSPPAYNGFEDFFNKLRDSIVEWKISEVIILTSQWQYVRVDGQLRSEALRYVASPTMELRYGDTFRRLEWEKAEGRRSDARHLEISGGGFAAGLFEFLSDREIPCALLLKYCSEGNNGPDAKELASFFNGWTSLVAESADSSVHWKEPPSWLHTFGHEPPREIY